MDSDLDEIFCEPQGPGVDALAFDAGAPAEGRALRLLFGRPYASQQGFGVEFESSTPQAAVRDSQLGSLRYRDRISIDEPRRGWNDYYVQGVHPDGEGLTILILTEE